MKEQQKIELIKKLADKYKVEIHNEEELKKYKKQLKTITDENRKLKSELDIEEEQKINIFVRFYRLIKNFFINLFKRKENLIVEVRKYFVDKYRTLVENYNYGFYTEEDLRKYINNAGTIAYNLQVIEKQLEDKQKKQAYDAILNKDTDLITEQKQEVLKQLNVYQQQERYLSTIEFLPEDLESQQKHNNEIKRVQNKMLRLNKILEMYNNFEQAEQQKEKKPVGRPKKKEVKNV